MSRFLELCAQEPKLEALRLEALEVAAWSGGNMNQIRDLWYGKQNQPGIRTKMFALLRDPAASWEVKRPGVYHEVYEGLWDAICSIRSGQD